MFWTDLYGDDIRRANLDGSNMTVLISTGLSAPGRLWGTAIISSGRKNQHLFDQPILFASLISLCILISFSYQ